MHQRNPAAINALILDMDGVLWRGEEPIGDLPAVFREIRQRGWRFTLATNNATLSVDQYREKLSRFGVEVERGQILNSAAATAQILRRQHPQGGPVFMIGEVGLRKSLEDEGFIVLDGDTPGSTSPPLAVVVGLDRALTYEKLRQAAELIRAGTPFIATNPDRTLPVPEGLIPGAGAILAALQAATDKEPRMIGKPMPDIYQIALERMGVEAGETLAVGDRLETDIAGAQKIGCHTALVLSGVSTPVQAQAWSPPPDYVAADLAALLTMLP